MTIVFIVLLISLNISVLFLIFLNPKPKIEIKTKNSVKLQETQELQDLIPTDMLLDKVYRDEISKIMKGK
jgi:hypothetical protein